MLLQDEYNAYILEHKIPKEKSQTKTILFDIMYDLTDRRGFRQEWDQIDDEIREEIFTTNLQLIERNLQNQ